MNQPLFPIRTNVDVQLRMSLLIWGLSGTGKSTLAATAPGHKLWMSFGDNEYASVIGRIAKDVSVMDLASVAPDQLFLHGISSSPFGLDKVLAEGKIRTVVCDSLTAIQYTGLQHAVALGVGRSNNFTPTMTAPGRSAYGGRNQNLLGIMKSLLTVTNKHRVHIIFTAHENDATTKQDGRGNEVVDYIGMSLGGQLVNNVSAQISEMWNLRQEPSAKRNRIITTRVSGSRRPMKTRMFSQKGESSFVWNYDPDLPDTDNGQMTLASFWDQFQKRGYKRIPIPGTRKGGDVEDNVVVKLGAHSG